MKTSGLTKSTIWYTLGNLFVRSINFLLLPLYSNFISPSQFGNYALLMSFYSFAMVLYQGAYQAALNKFYLSEPDSARQNIIFSTIARYALISAVILSLIITLLAADISYFIFGNVSYKYLILLLAAAMFFETAGGQLINYLVTTGKGSKVVLLTGAAAAVNFVINIYLIYFRSMGITGIITAQLIAAVVLTLLLSPLMLNVIRQNADIKLLRTLFVFTAPLIIGGLFSVGVDVIDRFILNSFLGSAEVGIYSFSYRIALLMNLFIISFRTAWMPYAIDIYNKKLYEDQLGSILIKFISAAGIIFIAVALLTNDLFDFRIAGYQIFKREYRTGVVILPYILGGYLLSGITSLYSIYPFITNRTYHFLVSDGLAFLVNVLLNFLLIPVYGITGAAIATLISLGAGGTYLIILTARHKNISYESYKIILLIFLIMGGTTAGYLLDNIYSDAVILGIYIYIILFVLKSGPAGLFPGKHFYKASQFN